MAGVQDSHKKGQPLLVPATPFAVRRIRFAAVAILVTVASAQADNSHINAASSVSALGASQTVSFAPVPTVSIGVAPFTLTATASSGLKAFTFATNSPAAICTVSGNKLNIAGIGTCLLTASQAGDADFAPASADASISVVASLPNITLIAVQSRKTHSDVGSFDLPIDTTAPPYGAVSVEPRLGNSGHDIVFQFNGPVTSLGSVSVMGSPVLFPNFTNQTQGSEVKVRIALDSTDNQRLIACLSRVNDSLTPSATVGFLVGDVSMSGSVNAGDIAGVKAHSGRLVDATNFIFDLNTDGAISASDVSVVKSRTGVVSPFPLVLDPLPFQLNGPPPINWAINTPYSFTFTRSGAPVTWSVAAGFLPPGLTLNPGTGVLSGTPTTAGTYMFSVQAASCPPPSVVSVTFTVTIWDGDGPLIPNPSKIANVIPPLHSELNGAGASINAWAFNPVRCNNTLPAINYSWQHNIDFADYGAMQGLDFFDMGPNEALTYKFVPTELGPGSIVVDESAQAILVPTFISLSSTPCDFDITRLAPGPSRDFCYSSQPRTNSMAYEVTVGDVIAPTCRLIPGATYYLNIRFQDGTPSGANTADSCALIGSPRCGGALQISR